LCVFVLFLKTISKSENRVHTHDAEGNEVEVMRYVTVDDDRKQLNSESVSYSYSFS
jgi:hypothetical protein